MPFAYQVGGSLQQDAPSYVRRQADEQLVRSLLAGEFCYVFNSRQMGKSSLRVQCLRELSACNVCCGVLDISAIGAQNLTAEQWYASIIGFLISSFQLDLDLRTWWRDRASLSPVHRLGQFLEQVLLKQISQNIVIFIDEIDSVLGLSFPVDDFFALIRACYNNRADQPDYKRLSFCLLGVATPSELIADLARTPFNIGTAIELNGFQLSEARSLVDGLVGIVPNPTEVLRQILAWTGGQPFLTQKLCQFVRETVANSESDRVPPPGTEEFWIEQLVKSKIIEQWESQDIPEHLKTIRDRLLHASDLAGQLLGLYQQILESKGVPADQSHEQTELLLSGLVYKQHGVLHVKNPIYRAIFSLTWVKDQLSRLRPYSQLLDAWQQSEKSDQSRLLRGQALLDAQAWSRGKRLSNLDYEFLAASQESDRQEIQLRLEADRAQAVEARLKHTKRVNRLQRLVLGSVSAALVAACSLGGVLFWQFRQSTVSEIRALTVAADGEFNSDQRLNALVHALKAKRKLEKVPYADPVLARQVETVLGQTIYGADERNQFVGHRGNVLGVAFSASGELIASCSNDRTVRVWKHDGTLLQVLSHEATVQSVQFSQDGRTIATGSSDGSISVWSVTGERLQTIKGHKAPVWRIAVSPDGDFVASASGDRTVKLWKTNRNGTVFLRQTLEGHTAGVWGVAFSPDSRTLITTSADTTIKRWTRSGWATFDPKPVETLNRHKATVWSAAFSAQGDTFVTSSADGTIKLWQSNGKFLKTVVRQGGEVLKAAISPDGQVIVSSGIDGVVRLWKLDGTLFRTFSRHRAAIRDVIFNPDGGEILSAGEDGQIKLWTRESSFTRTIGGQTGTIWSLAFSFDNTTLAVASGDRSIQQWQRDQDQSRIGELGISTLGSPSVAINSVYQSIATGQSNGTVQIWRSDNQLLRTLKGHDGLVMAVGFSPDGQYLATGGDDRKVRVWNQDGTLLQTLNVPATRVWQVALSSEAQRIVAVTEGRTGFLWRKDGTLVATLQGHENAVWGAAFSPDGKTIVTASRDDTLRFWKSEDGSLIRTIEGQSGGLSRVAFSPDGEMLATVGVDGTVKLWKSNGQAIATLRGHTSNLWAVAFSPDGKTLASGGDDSTIFLWNVQRILKLNGLTYGCSWVQDYLKTNPNVLESDRALCDSVEKS